MITKKRLVLNANTFLVFGFSLLFVGVSCLILAYWVDQKLCQQVQLAHSSSESLFRVARFVTEVGDAKWYFYLLIVLWFFWLLDRWGWGLSFFMRHEDKIYRWGKQFLWCLLTAGFCVHLLKFLFGRKRPLTTLHQGVICDAQHWMGLQWDWHFQSFPSGHSQLIFTVATFLYLSHLKKYHGRYFIWFLAFFVAITRVMTLDHFLSDVLMGAWVGFWGARLGLWLYAQREANAIGKDRE